MSGRRIIEFSHCTEMLFQVHAKHEEQTAGKTVFREYNREFLLPSGTDAEQIRSSLSKDGILTVEAPLPQPALTQEKKWKANCPNLL